MKGMVQYSSPPCTERCRLASINNVYSICFFFKTSYLNEEVKCTQPSFSVSVPLDTDN
jgi:hypothetical protein